MKSSFTQIKVLSSALSAILAISVSAVAQGRQAVSSEWSGWGLPMLLIVIVSLCGAGFLFWRRNKVSLLENAAGQEYQIRYGNSHATYEEGLDLDKELEWLRKAKKTKAPKQQTSKSDANPTANVKAYGRATGIVDIDTRAFQEKMRRIQYAQLPINSFVKLRPAKQYESLPYSDDPSLLSAIEQAGEEYEEDETVRELAVKILAAFRTRNSVEALSQIALYDLSSNLRSKAVSTLTDFDHPSVFESILLACADPTREVRAAAARGLFKLSFDRADAWKRIAETNDEYRMRHAARAAIESGIAVKSFERLVHEDMKVAHEAFSLVAFMISADETNEIFEAIRHHRDERVRFALLHVIKVQRDERTIEKVEELSRCSSLSSDVAEKVRETLFSFSSLAIS